MSDNRERLIMFSLWVSESARIFMFAAIATLLIGLDTAPLAWVAVAAIMGVSMIANWVIGGARGDLVTLALVQALVGFPVIYLAAAARAIATRSPKKSSQPRRNRRKCGWRFRGCSFT